MEIIRDKEFSIIKQRLSGDEFPKYDEKIIEETTSLIDEVLEEYSINSFDMITLLRENYIKSLIDTYNSLKVADFETTRYNCYYLCKVLKEKLNNYGVRTYFLSHKANNYALSIGDKKVKESHISLLYPTVKDDSVNYVIYDPGLKIKEPMVFEKDRTSTICDQPDLKIEIKKTGDDDYPYALDAFGKSQYSYTNYPHRLYEIFNPNFRTENVGELLFPISYKLLSNYKAIIFSKNVNKRAYIKLNPIDESIEYCNFEINLYRHLSYDEFTNSSKLVLYNELNPICEKLAISYEEIINNIKFMIEFRDDFIREIMDKEFLDEYKRVRK
ncbi:MAG: hypothetical protein ACI31R_02795 [Bacilli bacterium]